MGRKMESRAFVRSNPATFCLKSRRRTLRNLGASLLARGRQKGVAEPVGLALPRLADCFFDFREFIRAQPRGDKLPQGFALGLLWSANFPSHAKLFSVIRKFFLSYDSLCVTDIQVSIGTALSLERMAGTAAGESELTNSLPVCAGASRRESEMKTDMVQARSLAIEAEGDSFANKLKPKIRLCGKWLEKAGFRPGHRVQIQIAEPGCLTLRFVEQRQEGAL